MIFSPGEQKHFNRMKNIDEWYKYGQLKRWWWSWSCWWPGGVIPSRSTQYMEAACKLNTKLTIHPFAFRLEYNCWFWIPEYRWILKSSMVFMIHLFYMNIKTHYPVWSPNIVERTHTLLAEWSPGGRWQRKNLLSNKISWLSPLSKVSPNMEWTLLGKKDPQLPQMFYPIQVILSFQM